MRSGVIKQLARAIMVPTLAFLGSQLGAMPVQFLLSTNDANTCDKSDSLYAVLGIFLGAKLYLQVREMLAVRHPNVLLDMDEEVEEVIHLSLVPIVAMLALYKNDLTSRPELYAFKGSVIVETANALCHMFKEHCEAERLRRLHQEMRFNANYTRHTPV